MQGVYENSVLSLQLSSKSKIGPKEKVYAKRKYPWSLLSTSPPGNLGIGNVIKVSLWDPGQVTPGT